MHYARAVSLRLCKRHRLFAPELQFLALPQLLQPEAEKISNRSLNSPGKGANYALNGIER